MNERFVRIMHAILMSLTLIFAVITLGVSSYVVAKYAEAPDKDKEYPHNKGGYRDRSRIILTAAVWTTFWGSEYKNLGGWAWQRAWACAGSRQVRARRSARRGKLDCGRWKATGPAQLQAGSDRPTIVRLPPCRRRRRRHATAITVAAAPGTSSRR